MSGIRGTLQDRDWKNLLDKIKKGQCTPFIGAGACVGTLPLGKDIAYEWARNHGYPLTDTGELARVAQFMAIDQYPMFPKETLRDEFREKGYPDFSKPDEPHSVLADLDLPIYITTNYDDFMVKALEKNPNKHPQRELCRWYEKDKKKNVLDSYKPSSTQPLVYHLHGHSEIQESMVLTESDYLDFLVRLQDKSDPLLEPEITTALTSSALLFVGYSLADWNFRVLFKSLSLEHTLGYFMVAVQLPPNDITGQNLDKALDYLDQYFTKILPNTKVKVYWGDTRKFAKELRERWKEHNNNGN
jgi:hypothetical protein